MSQHEVAHTHIHSCSHLVLALRGEVLLQGSTGVGVQRCQRPHLGHGEYRANQFKGSQVKHTVLVGEV